MSRLWPILLLALGGALGTLARVGLAAAVNKLHGGPWPWGTFAANAVGCFLFGILFTVIDKNHPLGPLASLALIAGFCGAFTTFSTFAFDTTHLAQGNTFAGSNALHALGNLLLHNVVGITLLFAGLALGHRIASNS
ncbi:fluoride efflux transporter FluC [Algisphaera agarilytica]|uniref:Fluoride-specific ion channel FluC n=1 Tax=Algisphaera agarilytica TaxID=1385975 RepID=A0A7X0H7Y3_9BACT|nr:CrcB family protein [Algisphaera agarilytica]MBB6430924.1 CrcB protein [Algisphaera agarilytica]